MDMVNLKAFVLYFLAEFKFFRDGSQYLCLVSIKTVPVGQGITKNYFPRTDRFSISFQLNLGADEMRRGPFCKYTHF